MNDFTIGPLQILGRSDNDFTISVPLEGLEFPSMRVSSYDKPGEDGGVVSNVFYGMRSISIPGMVRGTTCDQYEVNRKLLSSACSTNKDMFGFPTLTRFEFTTLDGKSYYFYGQVTSLTFAREGTILASKFMVSVISPDSIIYSTISSSSGLIVRQSGTGFQWPFDWPILWGNSSGGTATLDNQGSVNIYPIITIRGSATNPYILNTTIDKFIQFNYVFSADDVLVIDMKEKTIILNGSTNLLSTKTSDSDWFWLQPGDNVFQYSTGSASDSGTVEITWNNGYSGV